MIGRIERDGFSATAYRLQLNSLLATPLLYAAMSILAAAFSLRLFRIGGLSSLVASAVGLGFLFFFLNQLCQSLGRAEVIPPLLAAWTPGAPDPALRSHPPGLHRGWLTSDGGYRKEDEREAVRGASIPAGRIEGPLT